MDYLGRDIRGAAGDEGQMVGESSGSGAVDLDVINIEMKPKVM